MGTDALDVPDTWGRLPQGGPSDYGAKAVVMSKRGVVIPTPVGGYAGGGAGDD